MTITTQTINRTIKEIIEPTLIESGFTHNVGRKYWNIQRDITICLELNALGGVAYRFGYPGISLFINVGIYFNFVPLDQRVKNYILGQVAPEEVYCHFRMGVDTEDQVICSQKFLDKKPFWEIWRLKRTYSDWSSFNKNVNSIWYLDKDGGNLETAIKDIKEQFCSQGIPWIDKFSDLANLYKEFTLMRESPYRSERLFYLSCKLGKMAESKLYYNQYLSFLQKEKYTNQIKLFKITAKKIGFVS